MRRRWRGILAGVSFVIFTIVTPLGVRSIWVEDTVWRTNTIEEPLTPEAQEYARRNGGFDANVIQRTDSVHISTFQGKVAVWRGRRRDPMSGWDQWYQREYVNRPHWGYRSRAAVAADVSMPKPNSGFWGSLGFDHGSRSPARGTFDDALHHVMFPIWPITLLSAIWPVIWLRRFLRDRHRRRGGLCMTCGYDLRGLGGQRCPECGMLPDSAATIPT